jgi:hypothetical protein
MRLERLRDDQWDLIKGYFAWAIGVGWGNRRQQPPFRERGALPLS